MAFFKLMTTPVLSEKKGRRHLFLSDAELAHLLGSGLAQPCECRQRGIGHGAHVYHPSDQLYPGPDVTFGSAVFEVECVRVLAGDRGGVRVEEWAD